MNPAIVFQSHCQQIGNCNCKWTCAVVRDDVRDNCTSQCDGDSNDSAEHYSDEHDEECMVEAIKIFEEHHTLGSTNRCLCNTCWSVEGYIVSIFNYMNKFPDPKTVRIENQ